jgi:putative membrane protein
MSTRYLQTSLAATAALTAAMFGLIGASPVHAVSPAGQHPRVSGQDQDFISSSAEGDLFEVAAGRLAMHRSHDRAVRQFGRRMVSDHTESYRHVTRVGHKLGVDVPTAPSVGQRAVLRSFRHQTGTAFVCAYVPYEWEDHQLDIAEARDEVADGTAHRAIADARSELPTLHEHLHLVSKILHSGDC